MTYTILTQPVNITAGLAAGVTEAVAVVTPMEVIKIRLQAQHHSMADPLDVPKYRNAAHALYTVVREEGMAALYRGVSLTALRQGSNQAVNFTAYSYLKDILRRAQPDLDRTVPLPGWQTTVIGLISGAMGPLSNAPVDTIKTRLQRMPAEPGTSAWSRIAAISRDMFKCVVVVVNWNPGIAAAVLLTILFPSFPRSQTGRLSRVLQGHHAAHHASRARPGCHLYCVRISQGQA